MFRFNLRRLLIVVPILGILCGAAVYWIHQDLSGGYAAAAIERSIRNAVPPITDRRSAEAWFHAHGVDNCLFVVEPTAGNLGTSTITEITGLHPKKLSGAVQGFIQGEAAVREFSLCGRATIYFFIDLNGQCVGHWVDMFEYCL